MTVTYRVLRHLRHERLDEMQSQLLQKALPFKFHFQYLFLYSVAITGGLNHYSRAAASAEERRDAGEPLAADNGQLYRCAIFYFI